MRFWREFRKPRRLCRINIVPFRRKITPESQEPESEDPSLQRLIGYYVEVARLFLRPIPR
jgi:hypothetical protein